VEATSVSTDRADQVSDHGSGTDPARVDGGEGLVNMRRRASKLGSTLTVISRPGGGASVLLKAPLRCVVTVSSHSDLSLEHHQFSPAKNLREVASPLQSEAVAKALRNRLV
jgi:hypothetical protein